MIIHIDFRKIYINIDGAINIVKKADNSSISIVSSALLLFDQNLLIHLIFNTLHKTYVKGVDENWWKNEEKYIYNIGDIENI